MLFSPSEVVILNQGVWLTTCGRKPTTGRLQSLDNMGWRQNLKRIWFANHCIANQSKFIGSNVNCLLFLARLSGSQLSFACAQFAGVLTGAGWSQLGCSALPLWPLILWRVCLGFFLWQWCKFKRKVKTAQALFEASAVSSLRAFCWPWPSRLHGQARMEGVGKRLWPVSKN